MKLEKIKFETFTDESGSLTPIEIKDFVDWPVARVYYLTDVSESRGGHCVKGERKIYVCQKGSVKCRFHDGSDWQDFSMTGPSDAIVMDGNYYRDFFDFSEDAVLMAISSVNYDSEDYIYDLNEFIAWRKKS
jgi:hypothetical protein